MFLRSVRIEREGSLPDGYPFSIPALTELEEVHFRAPVTFFAGENATGKSTLLESIAAAAGSIPVRGDPLTEGILNRSSELADRLSLRWERKTKKGFFLRAEDFFDYKKGLATAIGELGDVAADFDARFEGYGRSLAVGAALSQRRALIEKYGGDLNDRSHGESFLQFFRARFTGPGLYLLDEPDTALSAQSVLGLIAMLKGMVEDGAQFLIATHSPILLAFPGAGLISFDCAPAAQVGYDELEQVSLMRSFLKQPEAFLRRL